MITQVCANSLFGCMFTYKTQPTNRIHSNLNKKITMISRKVKMIITIHCLLSANSNET